MVAPGNGWSMVGVEVGVDGESGRVLFENPETTECVAYHFGPHIQGCATAEQAWAAANKDFGMEAPSRDTPGRADAAPTPEGSDSQALAPRPGASVATQHRSVPCPRT